MESCTIHNCTLLLTPVVQICGIHKKNRSTNNKKVKSLFLLLHYLILISCNYYSIILSSLLLINTPLSFTNNLFLLPYYSVLVVQCITYNISAFFISTPLKWGCTLLLILQSCLAGWACHVFLLLCVPIITLNVLEMSVSVRLDFLIEV